MYSILHGEDEFTRAEELANERGKLVYVDPALAELNTSVLEGRHLTFSELRHACDVVPFMAEMRMVIVQDLLTRLASRRDRQQESEPHERPARKDAFLEELAAYLPVLPSSTHLVFVESTSLKPSHPVLKLARTAGEGARVKHFPLPKDWQLPGWIQRRSRAKGGRLGGDAVTLLASLVGPDLRLLDQEIEKLLLYAGQRPVTADDVRRLVTRAREESIFDLVDCLGHRQSDRALTLLHRLLEDGEPPLYILAMLARQVRLLMQVSELQNQGCSEQEMASRLSLHAFVVKKVSAQVPYFGMAQLEAAHERLLEADWAIKTGEIEDVLALDMLVVVLTNGAQART